MTDVADIADVADSEIFIPEPEARRVAYTVISADDHVVEPPDAFAGRFPRHLREHEPRIVVTEDGSEVWGFDGQHISQIGLNAFAGRRPEHMTREPMRFDEMRPGCYRIDDRVRDMDVNGVWASLNFPSSIAGFCGRVFSAASDPEVGQAATRAWNDWIYDDWYRPHPDRIILNGLTYLSDPEVGAAEIRRNAARGFRSVTLPERPHRIGLPPVFDEFWDPILRACSETGTVVSLHVGSTGMLDPVPGAPQTEIDATMFSGMSLWACVEWLWSPYPRRYRDLRIVMSEGGIGWVAMLLDRLDKIAVRYAGDDWPEPPADILRRSFHFCTIDDYSAMATRHRIGIENLLVEVDYPHIDGTWPDTQSAVARLVEGLPPDEVRAVCCENAARLFRHPLPAVVLPGER